MVRRSPLPPGSPRPRFKPAAAAMGLALLLCLPAGCGGARSGDADPEWVARVGGEPITRTDFDLEMRIVATANLSPEPGSDAYRLIESAILEDLIRRRLFLLEARQRKITVENGQVEQRLRDLYGGSDDATLDQVSKRIGVPADRLRKSASDLALVENFLKREVYPRILVREEEIQALFEERRERLGRPERVRARQIVTRTRERIEEADRRLRAGEPFDKVARDLSETPEKTRGGDLGWVGKADLPSFLADLIFAQPTGAPSRPTQSDLGFHILQVTDRSPAAPATLEASRADLETELLGVRKAEAERTLLARLRQRFKVETALPSGVGAEKGNHE